MWVRAKAMALGGALGLVLAASSAGAQDYGPPPAPGYYGPPEEVIVTPPPYARQRSAIGAPIIDASLSRQVRIDDLDLRTGWGVRALRSRVSFTASTLCQQLNAMYPVTYDGGSDQWPRNHECYRDAFERGMAQADRAIRAARGYDYRP
ncbi:MAG TPA: UrcA family protein [Rhizomicrobium sp.]|nr:UrcA family protein [Rhizomicrobium sp.]